MVMKNSEFIENGELQKSRTAILEKLFALQDKSYQAFQSKLMPTISPETIIGVRTPLLRKLAKELSGTPQAEEFLHSLPHKYYEENNLHAFLIEKNVIMTQNWRKQNVFCPTSTTGQTATVSAQKFLQSIKKNC